MAIVVCDAVWRDPATGKFTILGTFSALQGLSYPLSVEQMAVYLSLTDARGMVPIKIRLIDADEEREPVTEIETEAEFPDPIVIFEVVAVLGGFQLPQPGEYRLQLHAAGEFVAERRILALPPPPRKETAEQ